MNIISISWLPISLNYLYDCTQILHSLAYHVATGQEICPRNLSELREEITAARNFIQELLKGSEQH